MVYLISAFSPLRALEKYTCAARHTHSHTHFNMDLKIHGHVCGGCTSHNAGAPGENGGVSPKQDINNPELFAVLFAL